MDNIPVKGEAPRALRRLREAMDSGMAPALAIMLDDQLFTQVQRIAAIMAKAVGFVPKHCVGNTEVCFAIATRSLVWGLDPFGVAQSTYQPVEGGKVAYEAKLVQAILEQSGRLDGPITREYIGDWSKVRGKFRMAVSPKNPDKKYPQANYTEQDEVGLAVRVSATLKGEHEPRTVTLSLRQCHPRNSTLWATDPETQAYYRAVRMLGNVGIPGVLMGVPFRGEEPDEDEEEAVRATRARDVTTAQERAARPAEVLEVVDPHGDVVHVQPGELEATVREWVTAATDDELNSLAMDNPELRAVHEAVEAEEVRRAERREAAAATVAEASASPPAEPKEADPADPLNLLGLKGAIAFLSAFRAGIEQASKLDADRYWQLYRMRARAAEDKVQAGDYASIEALVADKIMERE